MTLLLTLIRVFGSAALFLYGMNLLSDGLQKATGSKLRKILSMMTGNRFVAVITGVIMTVIIQSSSATTVMVVSFVNAGLMNLQSAVGVIMGANIGTTVTGWIVALLGFNMDITMLSLLLLAASLPLMFSKKTVRKEIAHITVGFAFLFLGLIYLQKSMPDISGNPELLSFLAGFNNGRITSLIISVLVGAVAACIMQSSSATMALTITMAYQGWIGVWTAAALCLGQNIGTTITAFIASLGTSTNAKRASCAHILFNVIGVVLALIFFSPLIRFVNAITPYNIFSADTAAVNASMPAFLAAFHTVFNLLNTLIFFPFIKLYTRLIERLIPEKTDYDSGTYHFRYISAGRIGAPEPYLVALNEESAKMGNLAKSMFMEYLEIYDGMNDITEVCEGMKKSEDYADQMQEQLIDMAVKILQESESPTYASFLNSLIRIIDEIESITDVIYILTKIAEDRIRDGLSFSEEERADLVIYNGITLEFLTHITDSIGKKSSPEALIRAKELEERMNMLRKSISDKILERMDDVGRNISAELITLDIIRNLEHIGDYAENIAEASFKTFTHTPETKKL